MNLRQFFTEQNWWGKLIGAFLGYLAGGSIGALFGIFIGNFFDRGLAEHFSSPYWHYHSEKHAALQQMFFEATFSIMGYIAKSDGRVSEQEIDMANRFMQEMKLNKAKKQEARQHFNAGKQPDFTAKRILIAFKNNAYNHPELIKLFADIQYRAAQVDGLTLKKQQALDTVFHYMGLAPLHQQHRFYEDFHAYQDQHRQSENTSSHQQQQRAYHTNGLEKAYAILEIPSTATKQEVKRAYRQLISRNHPDKLTANKRPASEVKQATEKTQAIRKAYEIICSSRGWNKN